MLLSNRRESPACSASAITGTRPAHDTRLSSSNTAESGPNVWDTCTGSAFLVPVGLLRREHQSFQLRGHFLHFDTPTANPFIGESRVNPGTCAPRSHLARQVLGQHRADGSDGYQ